MEARRVERVRGPRGVTKSIMNLIFYITLRHCIIFLVAVEKNEYYQARRAIGPRPRSIPISTYLTPPSSLPRSGSGLRTLVSVFPIIKLS